MQTQSCYGVSTSSRTVYSSFLCDTHPRPSSEPGNKSEAGLPPQQQEKERPVLARLLHADPTLWPLPESAARLRMVGKRPRVPSRSRRSRAQESKLSVATTEWPDL